MDQRPFFLCFGYLDDFYWTWAEARAHIDTFHSGDESRPQRSFCIEVIPSQKVARLVLICDWNRRGLVEYFSIDKPGPPSAKAFTYVSKKLFLDEGEDPEALYSDAQLTPSHLLHLCLDGSGVTVTDLTASSREKLSPPRLPRRRASQKTNTGCALLLLAALVLLPLLR